MSALPVFCCQCDPAQVPGRPGIACDRCGAVRLRTDDELLRHAEDAHSLRRAAELLDAISGVDDLCAEDALANLAKVERELHVVHGYMLDSIDRLVREMCDQRRRDNKEGRPTIAVAGAPVHAH